MGRRLRCITEEMKCFTGSHGRPVSVIEVTRRAQQARFLIPPTARNRRIIDGILARAKTLFGVDIYGDAFLSNHGSLLLGIESTEQCNATTCYIFSNIARELGRPDSSDWGGTFWEGRVSVIPILDERSLADRMRYLLANSTKEHLVKHPTKWPGAHCAKSLCEGTPSVGIWIDRTAIQNSRGRLQEEEATTQYLLTMDKLPCWSHLSDSEYQEKIRALCNEIAYEARVERRQTGGRVKGIKAIQKIPPHYRPDSPAKSPAPAVHSTEPKLLAWFQDHYRAFVAAYREASQRLRATVRCPETGYPPGSYPPGGCWPLAVT